MHWAVASPYFETGADRWIHDASPSCDHTFTLVPRLGEDRHWHQSSTTAEFGEWRDRLVQAGQAEAIGDGTITVFPQLAACAGLRQRFGRSRPLVAWLFNTEGLGGGIRQRLGRISLSEVDTFVVHSTREISAYSQLLGISPDRFDFVPIQYGGVVETERPPIDEPYVFATGSAFRDYGTMFEAVRALGYKTLVLASDPVLAGLDVPANVTIMDQISRPEIRRYVRHARVNVVPMADHGIAGGLVTIAETLRHGRSMVITDHPGVDDYVFDGKNALTVRTFDPASMANAIESMWTDDALRAELDAGALRFGEEHCTDEAAAAHLYRILDRFA